MGAHWLVGAHNGWFHKREDATTCLLFQSEELQLAFLCLPLSL